MLQGMLITLEPYTLERCHEFWRDYVSDPDMWERDYTYDSELTDKYYQTKVMDGTRRFFGIVHDGKAVGEIQLKYIDFEKKCATMSIHLANDQYKNHGWGTEAEQLLLEYAFHELGLDTIYADCVHRNRRSQHVLEKNGFTYSHEDDLMRYYVCRR